MKTVAILALHLGYGGVEKSIASLANSLVKTGKYKVEIVSIYNLYEVYNNEFKGLSNKGVEEYFELDKKYDNRVNYAEDFYTIDTNRLESVNNNNLAIENKLHNNDINNNMLEVANNRLEL